jgi:acetate kinase
MGPILVVNAGSSSVKFQVFAADSAGPQRLLKGQVDGIGTKPRLRAEAADKKNLIDQTYAPEQLKDVPAALQTAGAWLRETQKIKPAAVGHRVVHGGPEYNQPIVINKEVLSRLEQYAPLAPLHQPNNLAPIRVLIERMPGIPQVACFDTAFHRSHGALADHYAIPQRFYAEGVRRYGFHGLSYEFVASRLPDVAPTMASGRVIVAHLGSGASMCALSGGRSVESTMGFTALDGLPMGTRPGQLDPGVVLYLVDQKKMTAAEVQKLLYNECGLKGLSGVSNDVRELETSSDPKAAFALDYFVYRVGLWTGTLAAALGGLDAFVFTAGIGENSPSMRARIAAKLEWLGCELDVNANKAGAPLISSAKSRIPIYVVPTDEELMIAKHTLSVLSKGADSSRSERTVAA